MKYINTDGKLSDDIFDLTEYVLKYTYYVVFISRQVIDPVTTSEMQLNILPGQFVQAQQKLISFYICSQRVL